MAFTCSLPSALLAAVPLLLASPVVAEPQSPPAETREEREARMAWWHDAKFGMFIHWGVYAVPAGTYKGEKIPRIGEWIMFRAEIPVDEYRAFAKEFNPVKYDPEAWAELAEEAGMKYIVITAKHHDGFALFPSEVTDWDVADATPYGKDLITPLAEAARSRGLKFGTYYSQAQDWIHPGGAKAGRKEGTGWDKAQHGSFDEYLEKIAVPQVREILTRIKPDVLWWDTPHWMTPERARPLQDLVALRPGLITNNRLGGDVPGDTETPEQHVPATGFKDRSWETCMTMNDTWGFKSYDHNWKSTDVLLRNLVDIVSKGGNYLLNVGPTAEGEIPAPSIERLREMGAWMKVNGKAIYGTTASPFAKLMWGRCTKKVTDAGGTLYFHVFEWPDDGKLLIPGFHSKVTGARLLANGKTVEHSSSDEGVTLRLPGTAPDDIISVIEVDFSGSLDVESQIPRPDENGIIRLNAEWADIHNTIRSHAELKGRGEDAIITSWDTPDTQISWDFQGKPGKYEVLATISGPGSGNLSVFLGKKSSPTKVPAGKGPGERVVPLGSIRIREAGISTLRLKPKKARWKGFDLVGVTLKPAD